MSLVEWKQTELTEFINVEDAAQVWAQLDTIEQKTHWWKVEILKQVAAKKWMNEFLSVLKDTHNIDLSKRYANELRALGKKLEEVGARAPALVEMIESLPVSTATKVIRADNLEAAVEYAQDHTTRELETFLRVEKLDGSDFQPQLYTIWNFAYRDPRYGLEGYKWGLIAGQIVENLLYYFTKENDIVLDTMAGGGTTIDVCKEFERKCLAFDIEPCREDITQHDITTGPATTQETDLVILEPPYFNMKVIDAYDTYDDFLKFLETAIKNSITTLKKGGYVALIIADQHHHGNIHYPLIGDSYMLLKDCGLQYESLIGIPLSTDQFRGYDVARTKKHKELLNINRQMWVFKRGENR